MMRRVGWLVICCGLIFPNVSHATSFSLTGTCDGERITLRLNAEDNGDKPEVIAFRVYRRQVAVNCGVSQLVTPEPIPREDKTEYVISFDDVLVQTGVAYEYTIVGVDSEMREHRLQYAVPAWVICGDAPVAHGFIEDVGWALVVRPACPVHCNPAVPIVEWPTDIDAWIGRGVPVMLFGDVSWSDTQGPTMVVRDWRLETCVVSVEAKTWEAVKRLYR